MVLSYCECWITFLPLTIFRIGFFGLLTDGGRLFLPPLPKICHTYHAIMKLSTILPYLREIQKIYKSRDTFLEACWHQHFFTGNQQILLHQEIIPITLAFLESLVIVLIKMVTILMMSAKVTTPGLLKIGCFKIMVMTSYFLSMTSSTKFYQVIQIIL